MMSTGQNVSDIAFMQQALDTYERKTGISVKSLVGYDSIDTRLRLLQTLFAKRSSDPDICQIDNVWPGLLADDLLDLKPYLTDELTDIDKGLLDAFTVKGRLVALPEFVEMPVLYYRTDLLSKYGFKGPPRTWDELGKMAKVIQDGERKAGAVNFWGYIWQGAEGESLNCNAMEWQKSEGATLIDSAGTICALNPAAELALRRARSWIGTISPPSVVEYDEEDSQNVWLAGSAAFARGWMTLSETTKESATMAHRFAAAPMPAGAKGYAWTFGGMGLAVSRHSAHPKEAVQVLRYLVSVGLERDRVIASSTVPSRSSLLSDAALLQNTVFHGWLTQHWQAGMFARPSAVTGKKYDAVAAAYSKAVHDVIAGKQDAHVALAHIQTDLVSIMR
jgi:trehalose/maltose transport system substrate-binding protein